MELSSSSESLNHSSVSCDGFLKSFDKAADENIEKRPMKYLQPNVRQLKSLISRKIIYSTKFKEFSEEVDLKVEGSLRAKWSKRLVVIKNKSLKVFKGNFAPFPSVSLNFDTVSCDIHIVANSYVIITPRHFSKSLCIQPFTQAKLEDLCITLNSNITRSIGYNVELTQLSTHSRKFWKKSYITLSQLFDIGENGDLILFRSKSFGSLALRVASNSEYDHVGLLIRGKKGKIYIYESLGAGGVQINNIDYFVDNNWESLYKRISLRKLIYERNENFTKEFTQICSKWLGKPYKLTAKKLLRKVSLKEAATNFFCSELVAAVYKKIGLLPTELSSCQYWPSSFAQKHKLDLLKGALLGEELRIIFYQ